MVRPTELASIKDLRADVTSGVSSVYPSAVFPTHDEASRRPRAAASGARPATGHECRVAAAALREAAHELDAGLPLARWLHHRADALESGRVPWSWEAA